MQESGKENQSTLPPVTRRTVVRSILTLVGLGLSYPVINAFNTARTALDAIQSREKPRNVDSYEEFSGSFLGREDLDEIYSRHIEVLRDPRDGWPLISSEAFAETMRHVQSITRLHYNQLSESTRPSYKEFTDNFVRLACDMSQDMGMRPEVFLTSYSLSGQNINSEAMQELDIEIYSAQVGTNAVHEILGYPAARFIQRELGNPESYIFSEQGREQLQFLSDKLRLNVNMDEDVRRMYGLEVLRFLNPTIGSMDLEPVTYAQGYQFIRDHYPEAFQKYFANFPEAGNKLERLAGAKKNLDHSRNVLKEKAEKFLHSHPEVLDDFFDPETAETAFAEIGIGMDDPESYTYSVESYESCVYDMTQSIPRMEDLTPEEDHRARREFVIENTIRHFAEQAEEDPQTAREALIADQIFNRKFVNYLERKTNLFDVMPLRFALRGFNSNAKAFRKARLDSYATLSRLEYNTEFQLAISTATTRYLLEDVRTAFPELNIEHRNSFYWQMYLVSMIREFSSFHALHSNYLRPDVDPPYNNPVFLEFFRDYQAACVSEGVVPQGTFPYDYPAFADAEWRLMLPSYIYPGDDRDFGISEEQRRVIQKYIDKLTAKIFSGWVRVPYLGIMLGFLYPGQYLSSS